MAEEQFGMRKEAAREWPGWTRLFGVFKVALDYKKLLLAAAGILVMSFGWWLLAFLAFSLAGNAPTWDPAAYGGTEAEGWKLFKERRQQWNFLYRLAGTPPDKGPVRPDAADLADTLAEYEQIKAFRDSIDEKNKRFAEKIQIKSSQVGKTREYVLTTKDETNYPIKDAGPDIEKLEKDAAQDKLRVESMTFEGEGNARKLVIAGTRVELTGPEKVEKLYEYTRVGKTLAQIADEADRLEGKNKVLFLKALLLYKNEQAPPALALGKPYGQFRIWPWFEDRGPNPFLMLTGNLRAATAEGEARRLPWEPGRFFEWLLTVELPVLIEPLIKFLGPVLQLFNPAATGLLNRTYLVLVILWTLATWAIFGGAITRMAAVQLARKNEKVGLMEALRFAWSRKVSYFTAPLAPLIFLLALLILCIIAGFVQWVLVWLADVLLVILIVPGVLMIGLIMAVVLVGLIGWPLMYCTISTEGSDSFDAISRSYSYVFQSAWSYLWYGAVALVYGVALVFFVGLMGSLMVYLGKWGMSQTYAQNWGRHPAYLFAYAPTSFGWRDLLLQGSPDVESRDVLTRSGLVEKRYEFPESKMTWNFRIAAFLTAIWLYLVFLLVIGFGYSYFWTASAMIYLLMRRQVDDTDLEEIHLEEEEEEPFQPTPPAAPPSAKPAEKGTVTMLESPTLRPAPSKPPANETPPAATPAAPTHSEPPAASPAGEGAAPAPPASKEEPKP
jgi:hypothetical protein